MRVSDWLKFKVGHEVWDQADPRHVGRIDRIHWGHTADITWNETGWKSLGVPIADLRRHDKQGRVIQQRPERINV